MQETFDGLTHMRIEILIDPESMEYRFDISGSKDILIIALKKVIEDLENPDILNKLTIEPN